MKFSILPVAASALLLYSCAAHQMNSSEPVPELTFVHMQTIPVDVSRIDYDSYVRRGATTWDVAEDLPTPPDVAMQRYLKKRFRAAGANGILNVNLEKAQIVSQDVPNENKLLSYVPLANVTEYTFEIVVALESTYQTGKPNAKNIMRFVRKSRIPVDSTINFREAKLQRTLEQLMRDIDEGLLNTLSNHFKLVAEHNVPKGALPVKTQLPTIQTNTGTHWNEFKGSVNDVGQRIGDSLEREEVPSAPMPAAPQDIVPTNAKIDVEPLTD